MSNTLLTLRQRLRKAIGDGVREAVTTAIAGDTSIISTNLNKWDGTRDDYFKDDFAYIEDYNNAGVNRMISGYATSGGTCTVRGGNLTAETASEKATAMFTKINPDDSLQAIQTAVRKSSPTLYVPIDDITLITGNILPNFESWTATTSPDFHGVTNAAALETTTAGLKWGSSKSAKVTASAADGYLSINSDNYPNLLDLMGKTITFKCLVHSQTADDSFLTIHTKGKDGTTTQTLNSTTTCPATYWTLLELEDQAINDDLDFIEFRYRVHTKDQYAYFSNPRVTGLGIREYMLPKDFRDGHLNEVYVQTSGMADDPCDDLQIVSQEKIYPPYDGFVTERKVVNTYYKFLRLPYIYTNKYKLHLVGEKPLETLSADTDTISVDDPELELVIAQSALELFWILSGMVTSTTQYKFDNEIAKWKWEVAELRQRFGMPIPAKTMKFR